MAKKGETSADRLRREALARARAARAKIHGPGLAKPKPGATPRRIGKKPRSLR